MNIYIGKTTKITRFPCEWLRHLSMTRPSGFSKYLRKRKRLGQRKLILVALRTDNNALTFQHDYPAASHHCKDSSKTMSAVNSKLLTVLQEVNLHRGAERFPDEVCCPLHVRHFLILLVCCRNVVKFEWAPTDFF